MQYQLSPPFGPPGTGADVREREWLVASHPRILKNIIAVQHRNQSRDHQGD